MKWWETMNPDPTTQTPKLRAVAYYRHSAQDRQENSIPIQQDQVRAWAREHCIEIIHEFADPGKSGLNVEGRPAFTDMMNNWVKQPDQEFNFVLCLDVSRWGRFQDIDNSAEYCAECRRHGREVIYTTLGMPKPGDYLYPVYIQFERLRAAQYSRELSDKVWRGCVKIAEQGYWAGGPPPYGLQRLLLDERREQVHVLAHGQRKGIQNQRVTLVQGLPDEVAIVQRIFHEFTELGYSEHRIAEGLNADGIPSPGGLRWTAGMVVDRLRNEKYVGTIIYNQTSQKLKSPCRRNPPDKWVRTPGAFEGIISVEQFAQAQQKLEQRRLKYEVHFMLDQLQGLFQRFGIVRSSLFRLGEQVPAAGTYASKFGSLDLAFQQLYLEARDRARQEVHDRICQQVPEVLPYQDFLVLDQRLTVSIQPAVPVPNGYTVYWPFRPDTREVIDITLGVLLSDSDNGDILGYVALPRGLAGTHTLRIHSTSLRAELFCRCNLEFLQQLLL